MLRTPQFYVMYAAFVLMATGGLLVTANAGPMARSWGFSAGALTLAATLSPLANGAQPRSSGAGRRIGSAARTTMILTFVLQAVCLASGRRRSDSSPARGSRPRSWRVYFTWGADLLALPVHVRRLLRHAPRDVELRACSTPRRAWRRSSAAGSARCSSSSPAAGRWASTAAP